MSLSDEQKESIKKETRILQKCSHPNIVQYYGSFLKGDRIFLIMELCGVGCVLDMIKVIERPLSETEVLNSLFLKMRRLNLSLQHTAAGYRFASHKGIDVSAQESDHSS